MSDRLRAKEPPRFLAATVTAFMAVGIAGCSSEEERYVYCIDESGEVVDPEYCEEEEYDYDHNGGGSYWYYVSNRRHSIGSLVPSGYQSSRISPWDSAARANAGLPGTGRIGGTTIRSGGFGSGWSSDGGGS